MMRARCTRAALLQGHELYIHGLQRPIPPAKINVCFPGLVALPSHSDSISAHGDGGKLNTAIGARELFDKDSVRKADELDAYLGEWRLRVSLAHSY